MEEKNTFEGLPENPSQPEPQKPSNEAQPETAVPEPSESIAPTIPQVPESIEQSGDGIATAPKPSNKGPLILGGIAALLIAIILCVVAFGSLFQSPEKAVRKALDQTSEQIQVASQKMMDEVPALKYMLPISGSQSTDLHFALDSLQSDSLPGVQGELVSSILKLFSVDMNVSSDNAASLAQLTGKLNMGEATLADAFLQVSADDVAFYVPMFSQTPLSVNFATFKEDFKKSPFYDPTMTDETLDMLQSSLQAQAASFNTLSGGIDIMGMQDKLYTILDTIFLNAVYEKPVKQDGLKIYTIQLNGDQVKSTIVDYLQYIYMDSPMGKIYTGTMRETLEKQIIEPAKNLPPLPATLTLKVDRSGLLSQIIFTLAPVESEDIKIAAASFDSTFSNKFNNQKVLMMLDMEQSGVPVKFNIDVDSTYQDSTENILMKMDMTTSDGLGGSMDMGMDFNMLMDQAGIFKTDITMEVKQPMLSEMPVIINMGWDGTVTQTQTDAGMTSSLALPIINLSMTLEGKQLYLLTCNLTSETKPLPAPLEPVFATAKPLFNMTEEEFSAEMEKYSEGMSKVYEDLMGPFFSGIE